MKTEDFNEAWIRIAELDPEGRIVFTKEYPEIMGVLGRAGQGICCSLDYPLE